MQRFLTTLTMPSTAGCLQYAGGLASFGVEVCPFHAEGVSAVPHCHLSCSPCGKTRESVNQGERRERQGI